MPSASVLVALLVSASGLATHIHVSVRGKSHCPDRQQVMTAIRKSQPQVPGSVRARVELSRDAKTMTVVLRAGSVQRRRTVPVGTSQCSELAETVAFLTKSWLAALPPLTADLPKPRRVKRGHPTPPTQSPSGQLPRAPSADSATGQPTSSPEPPGPDGTPAQPPPQGAPQPEPVLAQASPPQQTGPQLSPPQQIESESAPAQPQGSNAPEPAEHARPLPLRPGLSVLLSGGGDLGIPGGSISNFGGGGSVALDLRLQRWHILLEGSLLSPMAGLLGEGSISVDRQTLSLLGAFELLQRGGFFLDAVAGARLEIWTAASHHFSTTDHVTVGVPGASVALRARVKVVWRLFAFARVQANLIATHPFFVSNVPGSVTPSILWGQAEAGLGFEFW